MRKKRERKEIENGKQNGVHLIRPKTKIAGASNGNLYMFVTFDEYQEMNACEHLSYT